MNNLKKCPFCGGKAVENNDHFGQWIECDDCGCRTSSTDYNSNDHIAEWDERHKEPDKICKNCRFNICGECDSDKICEKFGDEQTNDQLVYCYEEDGGFKVGDNFGCVHFKQR